MTNNKKPIALVTTLLLSMSFPAWSCVSPDGDGWGDFCPSGASLVIMTDPGDGTGEICDFQCDRNGYEVPKPRLECTRENNPNARNDVHVYSCEVWPKGNGLKYSWAPSPFATLDMQSPTEVDRQIIRCGNTSARAMISLTVETPKGNTSSSEFLFSCGKFSTLYIHNATR